MAPPRKPRRLTPLFLAAPAAILVALPMPAHTAPLPEAAAAADPADQQLTIDLAEPTGDFHGGASGLLYGLYGPGLPSDNLIEGMNVRTVAARAGRGQHPGSDAGGPALLAETTDGDIYVRTTDHYRGFSNSGRGDPRGQTPGYMILQPSCTR